LRKLEQQWAELYCTDVGAGVKKDSGPYTFVHHATDRGEYRQAAGAIAAQDLARVGCIPTRKPEKKVTNFAGSGEMDIWHC
jgi:hypothetical protein